MAMSRVLQAYSVSLIQLLTLNPLTQEKLSPDARDQDHPKSSRLPDDQGVIKCAARPHVADFATRHTLCTHLRELTTSSEPAI